jgi:hypothetical protein
MHSYTMSSAYLSRGGKLHHRHHVIHTPAGSSSAAARVQPGACVSCRTTCTGSIGNILGAHSMHTYGMCSLTLGSKRHTPPPAAARQHWCCTVPSTSCKNKLSDAFLYHEQRLPEWGR